MRNFHLSSNFNNFDVLCMVVTLSLQLFLKTSLHAIFCIFCRSAKTDLLGAINTLTQQAKCCKIRLLFNISNILCSSSYMNSWADPTFDNFSYKHSWCVPRSCVPSPKYLKMGTFSIWLLLIMRGVVCILDSLALLPHINNCVFFTFKVS